MTDAIVTIDEVVGLVAAFIEQSNVVVFNA